MADAKHYEDDNDDRRWRGSCSHVPSSTGTVRNGMSCAAVENAAERYAGEGSASAPRHVDADFDDPDRMMSGSDDTKRSVCRHRRNTDVPNAFLATALRLPRTRPVVRDAWE